ncbi:Uma2 family endonuclease [Kitasatospora sp. NPDC002227]|uniref:Uma2 family endonuclease n=1 Tax=Kitasatospora sp. NPDC002227 TaxID=3154773 RepID=UPI00332E663A
MTAIIDPPQMDVSAFENIAATAERDDVRMEFVQGRIGVKPVPDGDHDEIIKWLQKRCMQQRPDLWLYPERGLTVESYRAGRARPDAALASDGAFTGKGEWADPDDVLMVVEVTSYDRDADRRDLVEKPAAYAESGIPVYLLIDRERGRIVVHTEPVDGRYHERTYFFGDTVALPAPVGITLDDTEVLKGHVR